MRRCGCCRSCSTIVRCPTGHAPAVARKRAAQPRALRRGVHKLHRHSVVSAGRRHASNFRPTDALPHLLLWPRLENGVTLQCALLPTHVASPKLHSLPPLPPPTEVSPLACRPQRAAQVAEAVVPAHGACVLCGSKQPPSCLRYSNTE